IALSNTYLCSWPQRILLVHSLALLLKSGQLWTIRAPIILQNFHVLPKSKRLPDKIGKAFVVTSLWIVSILVLCQISTTAVDLILRDRENSIFFGKSEAPVYLDNTTFKCRIA